LTLEDARGAADHTALLDVLAQVQRETDAALTTLRDQIQQKLALHPNSDE